LRRLRRREGFTKTVRIFFYLSGYYPIIPSIATAYEGLPLLF
jgi:hypothetical protein